MKNIKSISVQLYKRVLSVVLMLTITVPLIENMGTLDVKAANNVARTGLIRNSDGSYKGTKGINKMADGSLLSGSVTGASLVSIDWSAGTPVADRGNWDFVPYTNRTNDAQVHDWNFNHSLQFDNLKNVRSDRYDAITYGDGINQFCYISETEGDSNFKYNYTINSGDSVFDLDDELIYFTSGATGNSGVTTSIGNIKIDGNGGYIKMKAVTRGCDCQDSSLTISLTGPVNKSITINSKVQFAARRNHVWVPGKKPSNVSAINDAYGQIYNKVFINYTDTGYSDYGFGWLPAGTYALKATYKCIQHSNPCFLVKRMISEENHYYNGAMPYAAIKLEALSDCETDKRIPIESSTTWFNGERIEGRSILQMYGRRAAASPNSLIEVYAMHKNARAETVKWLGDNTPNVFETITIPSYTSFQSQVESGYHVYGGMQIALRRPCNERTLSEAVTFSLDDINLIGDIEESNIQHTIVYAVNDNGSLTEVGRVDNRTIEYNHSWKQIKWTSDKLKFVFATNTDPSAYIDFPLTAVGNNDTETTQLDWRNYYRSDMPNGQKDVFKMFNRDTGSSASFSPTEATETYGASTTGEGAVSVDELFNSWTNIGTPGDWSVANVDGEKVLRNKANPGTYTGFYYPNTEMDELAISTELQFKMCSTDTDNDTMGCMVKAHVVGSGENAVATGYLIITDAGGNGPKGTAIFRLNEVKVDQFGGESRYNVGESKSVGGGTATLLGHWDNQFTKKQWLNYKVTISEYNTIKLYMDGSLVGTVYDSNSNISTGSIALMNRSQPSKYKDFSWTYTKLLDVTNTEVKARDREAPDMPYVVNIDNGVILAKSDKDNGTTYRYYGEAYARSNITKCLKESNTAEVTITTGIKGYYYYLDDNEFGHPNQANKWKDGTEFTFDAAKENIGNNKWLHIVAADGATHWGGTRNRSAVLNIPISYSKITCIDVCGYCGKNADGTYKHILGRGDEVHTDNGADNPYEKLIQTTTKINAEDIWGNDTTYSAYYIGYTYTSGTEAVLRSRQTIVDVKPFESKTVYRVFQPNTFKVRIHQNTPSIATYDTQTKVTGWTISNETSLIPKNTSKVIETLFRYEHTGLLQQSKIFSLTGWSSLANGYSNGVNKYSKTIDDTETVDHGNRTEVYLPVADYNPSTKTGGVSWTTFDIYGASNKDLATVDLWSMWIPNQYTLTYDKQLSQNSNQQGTGDTKRTEIVGNNEKVTNITDMYGYNTSGFLEYNKQISKAVRDSTTRTSKSVIMDHDYKDYRNAKDERRTTIGLYTPRAYWTVNVLSHYSNDKMKDYVVNNGTLQKFKGTENINGDSTNFRHKIESTFLDWYRPLASVLGFTVDQGVACPDEDRQLDGNNKLIRGTIKNIIPSNHTAYATWHNNSITLGVPKREYTITLKDWQDSNTKEYNTIDGPHGTQIDTWTFQGWYDTPCTTPTCDNKDHNHNEISMDNCRDLECTHDESHKLNDGVTPFTPTSNTTLYSHWSDNRNVILPKLEKLGYEFIGWFSEPQKDSPTGNKLDFKDAGLKYGGGQTWDYTDEPQHNFDGDMTLYAWWNKKPVFVDLYEGLFFEGQQLNYNDLTELIGVFDYEDDYKTLQTEAVNTFYNDLVQKIDQDIATDDNMISKLVEEKELWVYEKELGKNEEGTHSKDYDKLIKEADESISKLRLQLELLFQEKERLEQEREEKLKAIPDRARLLEVKIAQIDYLGTKDNLLDSIDHRTEEVTSSGLNKAKGSKDLDYNKLKLKTSTKNIGKVEITFQVSDEGVRYIDNDNTEKIIPNSDVTLEYTRHCQIDFNYNPLLYIQGVISYNSESDGLTLAERVIKQQASFDSEDIQDNIPWWGKYEKDSNTALKDGKGNILTRKLLHPDVNDNTIPKLQDSICITGVKNFKFTSAFAYEHQDVIDKFIADYESPEGSYHNLSDKISNYYVNGVQTDLLNKSKLLNEVHSFKGNDTEYFNGVTKAEVWRAITSIEVTFDTHDQWGKFASNAVSKDAHDNPDTPVDTIEKPEGYPENPDDPDRPSNPDDNKDKPYDKTIYQDEDERTTVIVIVSEDEDSIFSDASLFKSRVYDNVRYINSKYGKDGKLDTLGYSYWGTYGWDTLKEILQRNEKELENHKGSYKTDNGKKIDLTIKDYSK